jgi:hypothetical protein
MIQDYYKLEQNFGAVLRYGNGCALCPDCFKCPGPAYCVWKLYTNKKEQQQIIDEWKPFFDEKLSEVMS